jgi:hypothetical protein
MGILDKLDSKSICSSQPWPGGNRSPRASARFPLRTGARSVHSSHDLWRIALRRAAHVVKKLLVAAILPHTVDATASQDDYCRDDENNVAIRTLFCSRTAVANTKARTENIDNHPG